MVNSTGHFLWTINSVSFRADYNAPVLLLANAGNTSYPYDPGWNVFDTGNASSMRLVVENTTPVAHPMHLHGHNMYVLNEGTGTWDCSIVNSGNPQRRDMQLLQPNGYIVVQYDAVNAGVWLFHCHIAWHVSAGLYINLLVSLYSSRLRGNEAKKEKRRRERKNSHIGTPHRHRKDAPPRIKQANMRGLGRFHKRRSP